MLYCPPGRENADWAMVLDITPLIQAQVLGRGEDKFENIEQLNRFHTLSEKPAILALTNKAGEITLWSYLPSRGVEYQTTLRPHKGFVNLLQWTKWQVRGNYHTSYIASTCTDGTVSLSSVTVHVEVVEKGCTYVRSVRSSVLETWFENDPAVPTLIKLWDDMNDGQSIRIAISKGAHVDVAVIRAEGDTVELEGEWMRYQLENSSMGLGGASWTHHGKLLYAYTCEGECLALFIHERRIQRDDGISKTMNQRLLLKYKQQNMEEQAKLDAEDTEFISDMFPHLWGAALSLNDLYTAFVFTLTPAADVHYKTESQDYIWIAFTLNQERKDEATVKRLCHIYERYLKDPEFRKKLHRKADALIPPFL
ncbi:hypothetical protein EC973_002394 [Apophysomyces ossiformis]|uniref:Transcription factor IIIC 90kDa subunit N-terminal domain-containing protein n=1 Tax=Apophysomyces ossiformis TaxID=679940 RepID=A0A8H7BJ40_9FUNG|nr:hypothetical protein EC973_002394 [Apophysomyces ossiformis]